MKQILFLLFLTPLLLFSYSKETILQKLSEPPPQWMLHQIKNDFAHFSEGFTQEMLAETMRGVKTVPSSYVIARHVLFSIKNNVVTTESKNFRAVNLAKFLNELAELVTFPDLEFLFSHADCYEHPCFSYKTTVPVLSISKWQANNRAVLIPDVGWIEHRERAILKIHELTDEIHWEDKIDVAHWRGSTTDQPYSNTGWDYRPRARVVLFSVNHPDLVDASYARSAWLDKDLQAFLRANGYFTDWANYAQCLHHKYVFAIDGYAFAGSFFWQLLSNSVTLKHPTGYIEWYYNALQPFVHYVPYAEDLSDLEEKLEWLKEHQDEAQQIAQNATDFCHENLMYEDIVLYYYLVLQEYARLYRP